VAVSTSDPSKVKRNIEATQNRIADEFWKELTRRGLLSEESPV
jgi:D-threo-aldose 1-dehydrogenase